MDLFKPVVPTGNEHEIFQLLMHPSFGPERKVIQGWAAGFVDRDGKFVKEFQTTFESSFWELYLHAVLQHLGKKLDYSFHAPDFVITAPTPFVMEATIAAPPHGGAAAYGRTELEPPDDLNEFNRQSILRLCNSFTSKVRKYRQHYAKLAHVLDQPYVIAIAPFDRPLAHFAANRSIMATLYGIYIDEEATIESQAESVVKREVEFVPKHDTADVPVGMFSDDAYKDVSAVVYGPLATWGKVRALADAPERNIIFTTIHPSGGMGLMPEVRSELKANYVEHLLDGLYVFHNPYAERSLPSGAFDHERLGRIVVRADGDLEERCPDDFLLMRMIAPATSR